MDLGLKGRVAIVAAASRGLGKAVAFSLAREGARLAICARTDATLRDTAEEIIKQTGADVFASTCDVSRPDRIDAFVQEVASHYQDRIDILINNAGGPPAGHYHQVDLEKWREGFDRTFLSVVHFSRSVLPYMKKRKWGRIITITSSSARQPIDGLIVSNALRPAILGLTKTMARELGPDNILVNNVAPGMFHTRRHEELLESMAASEGKTIDAILAERVSQIPLQRMGDPSEHADLIAFLASEKASYITGATFVVDGGMIRGL